MGRRPLTTEQKAEKAARRREREREQRLVARQGKQTQNDETHIPSQPLPETIPADPVVPGMSLLSMFPLIAGMADTCVYEQTIMISSLAEPIRS